MSGERPYVRFDPEERVFWTFHTGLNALNNEELESAYTRAHEFIFENKERLVEDYGWEEKSVKDDKLFSVVSPEEQSVSSGLRYTLPSTFSSFLNAPEGDSDLWETLFGCAFDAKKSSEHLYIPGPHPLSEIFYMLQCIAPGMFVLVRGDDTDDIGEIEYDYALPNTSWVTDHADVLATVLGGIDSYQVLLAASGSKSRRESEVTRLPDDQEDESDSYDDQDNEYDNDWYNYSDESGSFRNSACGSDCGYCGHC